MKTKKFDFWQDHSLNFLEMAYRFDKRENIANPDGYGKHAIGCGDAVELFLNVENDRLAAIAFHSEGCLNTNACVNTVIHLVEGRSIAAAWRIQPEDVTGYLETLPRNEYHCAELAVTALRKALTHYHENKRHAWKKAYLKKT